MKKIYKILPLYAFLPIITSLLFNCVTYFGTRLFTTGMKHYDFSIVIDDLIPFSTPMITFYVLAYVSWVVGFIVIGRESRQVCYQVMVAEQIAKILCLICFIIVPTTIVRPQITGDGVFDQLTRLIYAMDSPDNLFPSIHCLENWICFRGAMKCTKVGGKYKMGMLIAAVLVFASTVFVKQHVFVDIIGGIAVGEIGLFLSGKFNLSRIYYFIENKLGLYEKNK